MNIIEKQIGQTISELVKSGYDKNNILCIGRTLRQKEYQYYAVIMPSFEQLLLKETLFSTKNITVFSALEAEMWYTPRDVREMWCLKYDNILATFLQDMDMLYKETKQFTTILKSQVVKDFYLDLGIIHYLHQEPRNNWIDEKTFFKQLTHGETDAIKYLANEIGASGTVSISKMIERYPISRPVWNGLFKKIQEFNIGTVVNRGVKGTDINITHPQLRHDMNNREI